MNDLQRFLDAQEMDYGQALSEIRHGRKRSHWIWYIFPQMKGLGFSYRSSYYGIQDRSEAEAYLAPPVLGGRLREITRALLELPQELTATHILGWIDAVKVRSCMTLFHEVSHEQLFLDVLNRFYDGEKDPSTLDLLTSLNPRPDGSLKSEV